MTRHQKDFNARLIFDNVKNEHCFRSLRQFLSYAKKNKRLPDYMSIGNAFFEMESYDLEGVLIFYANRSIEQQIRIEWDPCQNRYSKRPKILDIERQELGYWRLDIHYLSFEGSEK